MYYRQRAPELPTPRIGDIDDAFYLYHRTEAVVILYGNNRSLHADEHNHGGRILKCLDWMGKEGIHIRAAFKGDRCLCRSSIRALNLYLKHGRGLTAFRREHGRHYPFDRFGWRDLQELLNLHWTY